MDDEGQVSSTGLRHVQVIEPDGSSKWIDVKNNPNLTLARDNYDKKIQPGLYFREEAGDEIYTLEWMDADDILEEKEKDKFLQLKQTLSSDIDFVMMKYHTSFDEAGKPSFSYFRERWIRNCPQYRWIGAVHEVIPPAGNVVYSDIAVSHKKINAGDPDRNLNIYRKLLAEGKTGSATAVLLWPGAVLS